MICFGVINARFIDAIPATLINASIFPYLFLICLEQFFNELKSEGLLNEVEHSSGLIFWSFKMNDFYKIALEFFIDDIYTYLEEPPPVRPYSK